LLTSISPTASPYSLFLFHSLPPPPALHPFPTRRSSDLGPIAKLRGRVPLSRWLYIAHVSVGALACGVIASHVGSQMRSHRRRARSEEHTSELQSRENLVCRLLLEKKKKKKKKKK